MKRLRIMARHDSVIAMALLFVAGASWLVLNASALVWACVPIGIGLQLLNEYNIHRHLFHLKPPRNQMLFNLLYRAHYGHHDFPTCEKLLFVPIWFALPMAGVNFALVYGVASLLGLPAAPVAVAVVLVGGVGMFLAYEWFHMTAHMNARKTAAERRVTQLHAQHHFRDFSKWFHVSPGGEIIDKALGTAIDRDSLRQQSRIEFITTLGLRPDDPRLLKARARFAQMAGLSAQDLQRAAQMPATAHKTN